MTEALEHITLGLLELVREMSLRPVPEDEAEGRLVPPFSVVEHADWVKAVHLWLVHGKPRLRDLPPRDCPACVSRNHGFIFESYDGSPFHECSECGTWFVAKHINEEIFEKFCAECPEAGVLARTMIQQRLAPERAEQDMRRVSGYLTDLLPLLDAGGRKLSYLDLGCGVGHSLVSAARLGFQAHGIEVSQDSITAARQKGLSVSHASDTLPNRCVDLISLWETIEHLHNPREALAAVLPALREGGLVVLTFPNVDALPVRTMRSECAWVHGGVTTPGHINLFDMNGIKRLLDSVGLTLLDADGQYGSNLLEVVSWCLGLHRGIRDFLAHGDVPHRLTRRAVDFLNAIGPAWNLVERATLRAPLLRVVACRKGEEHRFRSAVEGLRLARQQEIAAQADGMAAPYLARDTALQDEVNKRDAMLQKLQDEYNALHLRAEQQQSGQTEANEKLQATIAVLQRKLDERQAQIEFLTPRTPAQRAAFRLLWPRPSEPRA